MGEDNSWVERQGVTGTTNGRAAPDMVINGRTRAGELVGGLGAGSRGIGRGGRLEAIALGTPCMQHLTPERRGIRVEAAKVAVGEEQLSRVEWEGRVRQADPVEGKVNIGVVTGLNKATDNTGTEGANKQLNRDTAAATLSIVLY